MTHVPGHNVEQSGNVFAWNPKKWGSPIPGVTPTEDNPWGANASQLQRTNYQLTGNINYSGQPQVSQNSSGSDMAKLIAALSSGRSGSGGTGAADKLARDKFEYDKRQDALARATDLQAADYARAREGRITSGLENYYGGGQGTFNQGFDKLLGMITDQGKVSESATKNAYARALDNINKGYGVAQGLGDEGYRVLNEYLAANQNNPYAGITAQVGSAPDALSNYLSAYGVSDMPVRGQIEADQLQAQQGAGSYQNLIDVLSGVAQQGAGSRAAESQMAQLLFNTGLGQERAGYTSEAENAQAQALAALQQAMFQSRFGVEGDRNSLANQLAQAVINAGGNPNIAPVTTQQPAITQLPDPRLVDGQLPTAGNMYEGPGLQGQLPPPQGQLPQTASPQEIVANQLANLLAPAQAQNTTAQELLAELNARRGR